MNTIPFPIKSTTQDFIEIEEIDHDIVMYVDGSCSLIISTTAVNFSLLSINEQEALITQYAGLLNSLSFPIQLFIRTQHKDVTSYLKQLEDHEKKATNPKIASSIKSYREFVITMVKEKNVLDKKFYIILPFSSLELGPSAKVLFGTRKKGLPYAKSYIFERALTVLTPKRDHLLRLLARLGLRGFQLTNEQLALLFFTIYNPTSPVPSIELLNKSHSIPFVRDPLISIEKSKALTETPQTPLPVEPLLSTQPNTPQNTQPMVGIKNNPPLVPPHINKNNIHDTILKPEPAGWFPQTPESSGIKKP
jgi:hypothetical protein